MLNNLTNFFNLIKIRMVKTVLEDSDLFVVGTRDTKYDGSYKPVVAPLSAVVNSVINQLPPSPPGLYGLYAQTANSIPVTGTTAETSLINGGVGTLSVPANGFQVGDSFRAIMAGVLNAANNQTIRIRVKTGSVVLLDSGLQNITNITNDVFSLNIDFTIRQLGTTGVASIVSLGTFHYAKTSNTSIQGFAFNVVNNTTFSTTIPNTIDITVEWGSTNAGNSIYSDIFILNKTY